MAFVKYTDTARRFEVGEWAVTTRRVTSSIGYLKRVQRSGSLAGIHCVDMTWKMKMETGYVTQDLTVLHEGGRRHGRNGSLCK